MTLQSIVKKWQAEIGVVVDKVTFRKS